MVIYSTLIDAATEHVEIFGKAGSTTIREIKIENPQDSTIVLFIEKVSFFVECTRPADARWNNSERILRIELFPLRSS